MNEVSKRFDELSARELYEILKARATVFVAEQNINYVDMDDIDYKSLHVFFEDEGRVQAYLRVFETDPRVVRMGRVLTIARGTGLGRKLVEYAIGEIKKEFAPVKIVIDSQCHATGFYEKLGFEVCSERFMEEGIQHVKMVRVM